MNLEKFTNRSREALASAQQLAIAARHTQLSDLHLFKALLEQQNGLAGSILSKMNINVQTLNNAVDTALAKQPHFSGSGNGDLYQDRVFSEVLVSALDIAEKMKDEFVSVEHLLLALSKSKSESGKLLKDSGVSYDNILKALQSIRGNQRVTTPDPENTFDALNKYGRDLTLLAAQGKLDPVIGRDDEIRQAILSDIDRGVTMLAARGGYSGKDTDVVLTVVSNREMARIERLVHSIDPMAFIIINRVNEVIGRGFSVEKKYR